MKGVTTSSSF